MSEAGQGRLGEMFAAMPVWVWIVVAAIAAGLLVMASGPIIDAFWEAVYWARMFCLWVGVLAVIGGAVTGLLYATGHIGA